MLSTVPFSVTTPPLVSTSICSALRFGSAISAVLTEPVIAASPTAAVALFAAASVFAATLLGRAVDLLAHALGAALAAARGDQARAGHQRGQQCHPLFGYSSLRLLSVGWPAERTARLRLAKGEVSATPA